MFVCLCKAVTDTQIKRAVENGANSFSDIRAELGVATQCCKCVPEAREIVDQALKQKEEDTNHLFSPALYFPA